MRMLVVGAGGTGGYFGGRLAQAGRDVTFLVRRARAEQLRAAGLRIVSPHGDAHLHPTFVTAETLDGPYDVLLLTVKAFALPQALEDMAPAVGPATMIVPTLNGMRHIDATRARFGDGPTLGGVCRIPATLDDQGRVVQLGPMHDLVYGELAGGASDRVAALDAFMRDAGFNAQATTAVHREMWEKWVLLATLGGITCLMRGTVGEIAAAPGGPAFVERFLDETVRVVTRVGDTPGAEALALGRAALTAAGSPLTSSMYRDLRAGLRTEADQILGDLLARAEAAGEPAPLLAAAYTQLMVHERRLAG